MAIPEQIRKQSEAVAKLYEDLNPTDEDQSSAEVEAEQSEQADGVRGNAPESESAEQGQSGTTNGEQTAEQRYRTLQGMYNADTARLRAENNQMKQRTAQLEQLIASLSEAQKGVGEQTSTNSLLMDKDLEEYGDSIAVMRRAARAEVQAEMEAMRREIAQFQTNVIPKVEGVVQRQALSAEQSFWTELTNQVPDWREINAAQGFHDWLLEVDPLTGSNRQTYLDLAQNQLDARRVAEFFRTWQAQSGTTVAHQTRSAAASQLEKQIAPGRGRTSTSTTSGTDNPTFTRAEVAKFFDEVRKGLYKGREQERDRIERAIFAAQGAGRIT